jgi:hypothetical protein
LLLGAPCRVRDVRVGEVASVFVDAGYERVIGLGILGIGGVRRFLPWVTADVGDDGVSIRSSFLLVDDGDTYMRLGAHQIDNADELAELRVEHSGWLAHDEEDSVSTLPATGTSLG